MNIKKIKKMLINFIIATLVAISVAHGSESDFSKTCPPSQCGSLLIRFPLRLQSDNPRCSLDGLVFTCSPDSRTLHLPAFPQFKITNISCAYQLLTLDIGSISLSSFESSPCPLQNLSSAVNSTIGDLSVDTTYTAATFTANFLRCSKKISPVSNLIGDYQIAGPIPSCYEKKKYFVYVASSYEYMDVLGHDCEVFWRGEIPDFDESFAANNVIHEFSAQKEVKVNLSWDNAGDWRWAYDCSQCERKGEYCGFDWGRNQTFCLDHDLVTGSG